MPASDKIAAPRWRVIVIGGHTRSIGKTQLVCDVIAAFPQVNWIAGKITQYGHGVCAQNGENCDCAPDEHICAMDWETRSDSGTDSARFLAAGARQSFWLRTKQGYLAEGLPLLRASLQSVIRETKAEPTPLIVEPSLYVAVIDPAKEDFKESARAALDRADALVLRGTTEPLPSARPTWLNLPSRLLKEKPSVIQREGEPLPEPLQVLVRRVLEGSAEVRV